VFEKGLHRDPTQRYGRASAFVNALADTLTAATALTHNDSPAGPDLERVRPAAASSGLTRPWGSIVWNERLLRRLAACLFAAVYIFSVYG
jgi:hypothetical protein